MSLLRVSTPEKEGLYQGSKYLKVQVLCDAEELEVLFREKFWLFPLTGLTDGQPLEPAFFLREYAAWIEGMKQGKIPADAELRRLLACAMTADLEALWLQSVPESRSGPKYLMKIAQPVVQVQAHFFTYSDLDGVFRPMTMGPGSIFWGLQFSFPQIYQNPKTMELLEVEESANSALFDRIRTWARETTRATPFSVGGKRVNATIRIGKKSLAWAGSHPQLVGRGLGIWQGENCVV